MIIKRIALSGAVTIACLPCASLAQTVTPTPYAFYTTMTYGLPSYTTASVSETYEEYKPGDVPRSFSSAGVTVLQFASVGRVESGYGTFGFNDLQHLNVGTNGDVYFAFSAPIQFFSFDISHIAISTNNGYSIALGFANGTSRNYNLAVELSENTMGRLTFDMTGQSGITNAVLTNASGRLLINDIAIATPEAATWTMMIVGLGAVGGSLRRRRNVTTRVTFA